VCLTQEERRAVEILHHPVYTVEYLEACEGNNSVEGFLEAVRRLISPVVRYDIYHWIDNKYMMEDLKCEAEWHIKDRLTEDEYKNLLDNDSFWDDAMYLWGRNLEINDSYFDAYWMSCDYALDDALEVLKREDK